MADEKSTADQVKEAAWTYTAWTLVLVVVFLAGVFLGWQLWGAGDNGQPALAAKVTKMDEELNRVKNEREDCQKVLQVTQARKDATDKELNALKARAGAAQ